MRTEEFLITSSHFSTREFAQAREISIAAASRKLKNLHKSSTVEKITRSIWANPKHSDFSRYALVPHLLGKEQGYVSFLSALDRHGAISQIPNMIYIATTGRGRKLRSKLGEFEFLKIKPEYMRDGIEWFHSKTVSYGLASPEKALLDCLYISTRRSNRFASFPEIDKKVIRKSIFFDLLRQHRFPKPIRIAIEVKFKSLFDG